MGGSFPSVVETIELRWSNKSIKRVLTIVLGRDVLKNWHMEAWNITLRMKVQISMTGHVKSYAPMATTLVVRFLNFSQRNFHKGHTAQPGRSSDSKILASVS